MVIIHLVRTTPIFPERLPLDEPGMKLGQSYAEEIVDYYIIGPSLETAVLAQLRYGSAFTGNPQPQVARIISDNAVISAIGNKEVAQGVAEVAAGKRPYWLVMVRTKK